MDLRNRLLSTSQIIAAIEVLMPKLLTEVSENPSKEDNCVSEMRKLPAWFMLRVIVDNNGRMTKLISPTEVKLGALSVCKSGQIEQFECSTDTLQTRSRKTSDSRTQTDRNISFNFFHSLRDSDVGDCNG